MDALFEEGNRDMELVGQCMREGIESGVVRPLRPTVFGTNEIEDAFRFMAQGKHIGKVLIKVIRKMFQIKLFELETYLQTCAPNVDLIQPAHACILIRIATGRISDSQKKCNDSSCG